LIASLGLAGCFYVDPINQRPSLDIKQDNVGTIFRDDDVSFTAVVVDPDGHDVDLTWRVYLCTDATTFSDCDAEAKFDGLERTFGFKVPKVRMDDVTPVEGFRIVLDGKDDHGATAKPTDQLQLPVLDRHPDLTLRKDSLYKQPGPQFVIGMPIDFYALYGDGDDSLDALTVNWKVYPPSQVTPDFVDGTIDSPMGKRQVAKILRPQVLGEWTVEVTVTDPVGNSIVKSETLNVVADRAPCISSVMPIVPPTGVQLIVMDPTVFEAPVIDDDLDSHPRSPGGAEFGESKFVWSIQAGGPRQQIGTGSYMLFDPSVYTPGTSVEVRVEIQDRKLTPVNCTDSDPTCSVGANGCIQRQTWKVEAR
jgi:hypothetical protein